MLPTSNEHHANSECLFSISIRCHIAKSHGSERGEREIQSRDIARLQEDRFRVMRITSRWTEGNSTFIEGPPVRLSK